MKEAITSKAALTTKAIIADALSNAMTYDAFKSLVKELSATGGTSGPEQTDAYKEYTVLNDQRMKRWDKTLKIADEKVDKISRFKQKIVWLVITESWCGDAAPTLPVMNKITQLNPNIDLKIVMRNQYPELMDLFLTDGKMSIPKLIMIDQNTYEVLGSWGPLPGKAMMLASEYKEQHGQLTAEFKEDLQVWFNADKGKHTLLDLMELLALE